jgi:hypothetical protein
MLLKQVPTVCCVQVRGTNNAAGRKLKLLCSLPFALNCSDEHSFGTSINQLTPFFIRKLDALPRPEIMRSALSVSIPAASAARHQLREVRADALACFYMTGSIPISWASMM